MTNPHGAYEEPPPGDPIRLERSLANKDWSTALDELLGLALHHDDWRWVQDACLALLDHEDVDLRRAAVMSLGHIARIHGVIGEKAVGELEKRRLDAALEGRAQDALDDIDMFASRRGEGGQS